MCGGARSVACPGGAERMPLFSLVLATCGRTNTLDRLLDSLLAQACQDFELLVVDQNPDDRLQPWLARAAGAGLVLHHLRLGRPNLSGARNLGIAQARGAVVCFPDDDCWYEPDTLARVKDALALHPPWGALVACWVEQAAGLSLPCEDGAVLSLDDWRCFRGGHASSITLFVRAGVLSRYGGFDERMGVGQWYGAGEETDWVLRVLQGGVVVARSAAARVHHRFAGVDSLPARLDWRAALRRARGTGAIYAKHRLPAWVVVRGLLAPLREAADWRGTGAARWAGLANFAGRLQGAVTWLLRH